MPLLRAATLRLRRRPLQPLRAGLRHHPRTLAKREERKTAACLAACLPEAIECLVEKRDVVTTVHEQATERRANVLPSGDPDELQRRHRIAHPSGMHIVPAAPQHGAEAEQIVDQ